MRPVLTGMILMTLFVYPCAAQMVTLDQPKETYEHGAPTARLLPYPYPDNVVLGQGWDSVEGKPKLAKCITFEKLESSFQETQLSLNKVYDDETLDITSTIKFGSTANFGIGKLSGGGEANLTLGGSYKATASTDSYVVSVHIQNGAESVGPGIDLGGGGGANIVAEGSDHLDSVRLTPFAAQLLSASENTDKFLTSCGDSFVAGILKGGSLHFVYNYKTVSHDASVSFDLLMKGNLGFAGLGSASSHNQFDLTVKNLVNSNELNVTYFQTGAGNLKDGTGIAIPVDLETLRAVLGQFSASVFTNGKPSYIVTKSYSELPGWESKNLLVVNLHSQQNYRRIFSRLAYISRTIDEIQLDKQRDPKRYLSAYLTQQDTTLRKENVKGLQDYIFDQAETVTKELIAHKCEDTAKRDHPDCQIPSSLADDYAYRILLPLPRKAIPEWAVSYLNDPQNPRSEKMLIYARYLFWFWVDQPARARCEAIGECLRNRDLTRYYQMALESLEDNVDQLELLRKYTKVDASGIFSLLPSGTEGLPSARLKLSDKSPALQELLRQLPDVYGE